MRVTVNDIAQLLGISQSTVSKVLNNYPNVKESTRREVLKAIEELNFTPNSVARSMVTKRTNTIGLIVGDISNPYFAESSKIIIEKAKELGYDVIISNTNHNEDNLDAAIDTLLNKWVDGILITSASINNQKVKSLFSTDIPIMLFINLIEGINVNYAVLNNERGSHLAIDHLVDLGHKDIAFLSGPLKYSTMSQRYKGYLDALNKHQLPIKEEYIYFGEHSDQSVLDFIQKLLESKNGPTAFFATSDQLALEVLDIATKNQVRIPEDISVIGFDDMKLSSNKFISLTTISQQKEEMASRALDSLVTLIEKKETVESPIQIILEPELTVRKTSGIMRKSNVY